MLAMVVADAVLNSGTDFNETQPLNILLMFVTDAVLNRGTDWRDAHPENIDAVLVRLWLRTVAD
jgi:hypothetical protein